MRSIAAIANGRHWHGMSGAASPNFTRRDNGFTIQCLVEESKLTEPTTPPGPTPPSQASPPGASQPTLADLINVIADRAKPIIDLITTTMQERQKGIKEELRFQVHMAWVAISVVIAIVAVAAVLTYLGKIDGSTFAFLLGLIVGYVLTFVRDQIMGPD